MVNINHSILKIYIEDNFSKQMSWHYCLSVPNMKKEDKSNVKNSGSWGQNHTGSHEYP